MVNPSIMASTISPKPSSADASASMLYDSTICIGCKACQVACKKRSKLPPVLDADKTHEAPTDLSADVWTLIKLYQGDQGHIICQSAMYALHRAGLCIRLSGRSAGKNRSWSCCLSCRKVHRLPLLHGCLPVLYSESAVVFQFTQDPEMRFLRRPVGQRAKSCLRRCLPDWCIDLRYQKGDAGYCA